METGRRNPEKHAIVSVTNDLTTDQRVDRTCLTLVKAGYKVLLAGRIRPDSKTLAPRNYQVQRLRLLFEKGPLFYAEFNIRLFFFLLSHPSDLLVSNDTDTLPATFLAHKLLLFSYSLNKLLFNQKKSVQPLLLHDCHEYFIGVPELTGRMTVTAIWKWMENRIFPKLQHVIAVNQSVAELYIQKYGIKIQIIRNVPFRKKGTYINSKHGFDIRDGQKIIIYQGAVNIDRGVEEAILAMQYLKTDALLIIAGTGDIFSRLQNFISALGVKDKVMLTGQIPFQELHAITIKADLGLSIEKDVCINYRYSLPNKFLDYIQARVPVLVSPFPEMKAIVDLYHIGTYIESHDPEKLAAQIDRILNDQGGLAVYKKNLEVAATVLCWENEEETLLQLIDDMEKNQTKP